MYYILQYIMLWYGIVWYVTNVVQYGTFNVHHIMVQYSIIAYHFMIF